MMLNRPQPIISSLFIGVLFVLFCHQVSFADGTEEQVLTRKDFFNIYTGLIVKDLPFPANDLEISSFHCQPEQLSVPYGSREYRYDFGPTTGRLGLRTFSLNIMVDKKQVGQVKVTATVHLFGTVVTTTRALKRGHILTENDLQVSRRDITMLGSDILHDTPEIMGKQLKTSLRPGALLYASLLKKPQVVKRGDLVTIKADSDAIQVTVPGKARAAGAIGDIIRVKNTMSRKEIMAQIVGPDEVKVQF